MNLTRQERLARLDTMLAEGRIIHGAWTRVDNHGRELACLLAALSPEAGKYKGAVACPAEVMPQWMAHLTPSMDDDVSDTYRPKMLRRYALLAHRWHVLDDAAWRRAEYRVRAACVRESMRHTDDARVLECCRVSLALCERVMGGDEPASDAWAAARAIHDAARAAASSWASNDVARAGVWAAARAAASSWANDAAKAAADVAAKAANDAARDAAKAVRDAARAALDAARNARAAARAAAWDRLTVVTLDAIETEISNIESDRIRKEK